VRSGARIAALERFFPEMDCAQTVAVESGLRALQAPALIVWGGADVFFERQWAYWLRDTLPNVRRLVELPTGRLFFPLDRPEDLARELLAHWS
jgi:pimeloyl-ACP methyl ester carboxylesterase